MDVFPKNIVHVLPACIVDKANGSGWPVEAEVAKFAKKIYALVLQFATVKGLRVWLVVLHHLPAFPLTIDDLQVELAAQIISPVKCAEQSVEALLGLLIEEGVPISVKLALRGTPVKDYTRAEFVCPVFVPMNIGFAPFDR